MIRFLFRSFLTALLCFCASLAWSQPLPDTGQSACFDNIREITCPQAGQPFYGQDAQYQSRPRSYSKLGHNGVELGNDAAHADYGGPWLMTRDNVTGLIWETKTAATRSAVYTWSQAGNDYVIQANASALGGFDDWRLPTIRELASLIYRGAPGPAMELFWFPNAQNAPYWAATGDWERQDNAWQVDFTLGGFAYPAPKDWTRHARLVRGSASARSSLIDNGDGTVSDPQTGLTWQKSTAPGSYSWQAALEYAEGLSLGGHDDWRLPSVNELLTLVDHAAPPPSVIPEMTQATAAAPYWSSTTNVDHPSMAWPVDFRYGGVGYGPKSMPHHVRAVRTGQTASRWGTEIGIVNFSSSALANGVLRGFDGAGLEVWSSPTSLPAYGRLELNVADAAGSAASRIRSMRLDFAGGQAVGYLKFYQSGKFRVGLEASPRANLENLYVPHIASDDAWWTGVGWTNTTANAKTLRFSFDNGESASKSLDANGHDAFTIASLFDGAPQPDIGAAQVAAGDGMVGLMLFGGKNSNILSGVSLSDATTTTLHFPHVADDDQWWTGICLYNPGTDTADLTLRFYGESGNQLTDGSARLAPYQKMVGFPDSLGFPAGTAWFSVESSQPVTGFELFGSTNGNLLAGYSVVDLAATEGVFPKLERNGWTGIAFVNIEDSPAMINLTAQADNGEQIASNTLQLEAKTKISAYAENLFSGQDISAARYVRYSADKNVVGFQLNGSSDGTMLDAVPALGSAVSLGANMLYFPHIDAQQ